jgi:selenocysteine lyase/cysteine desulfurase
MLQVLRRNGATVYGIADEDHVYSRIPTFCFNLDGLTPQAIAEAMACADIGIRDGHMYAPRLMARLGLAMDSGAVRASLVHYNTVEEICRFGQVLEGLVAGDP